MRKTVVAALVAAVLVPTAAQAAAPTAYPTRRQEPVADVGHREHAEGEGMAPARGGSARREDRREARRSRIQAELGITDAQAERLEAIMRESAQAKREALRTLAERHRALRDLVEAGAPEREIKAALDRMVEAKRAAARAGESYERILEILGTERTARFALMGAEFRMRRRGGETGWRGSQDPRWQGDRGDRGLTW